MISRMCWKLIEAATGCLDRIAKRLVPCGIALAVVADSLWPKVYHISWKDFASSGMMIS